MQKDTEKVLAKIYAAYGTDSGILFGIKEKAIVENIIKFTLKYSDEKKELFQMVKDLKNCVKRLSQDGVSQFDRDKEAQWEGEAHELLTRIDTHYYKNANEAELTKQD